MNGREIARARFAMVLAWAVAAAVNAWKPVHIDDTAHLAIAEHILRDPVHPMSGVVHWGERPAPIHDLNQPHLFFYALAATLALDRSLVLAHLLVSLFAGLGAISLYRLARSIDLDVRRSAWAVVAFLLGPALLPSQNLMTDVPLVSLFLVAIAGLARAARHDESGADGDRATLGAAFAVAAACLVKYTGLALLPVLALDARLSRKPKRYLAVLVPILALVAWSVFNLVDYGGVHILSRPMDSAHVGGIGATVGVTIGRFGLFLVTLGAVVPFAAGAVPAALRSRRGRVVLAGSLAFVALGTLVGRGLAAYGPAEMRDESVATSLLRAAFAAAGIAVATHTALAARRLARSDDVRLARIASIIGAWALVTTSFVVLLSPFVAVRHVLLVVPPVLLLLLADGRIPATRGALALTIALGLVVALADHRYAAVFEDAAPELATEAGAGHTVWYDGHWGFQYYAERAGMRAYVPGESELARGDLVVVPTTVDHSALAERDRARLDLRETREVPGGPLDLFRTVTTRLGFYSVWQGVPWTLTLEPVERFEIYEARR